MGNLPPVEDTPDQFDDPRLRVTRLDITHPVDGEHPTEVYLYRDPNGAPLHVAAQFNGHDKLAFTWNAANGYAAIELPKPAPLYGLERLAGTDKRVLLTESEASADRAAAFWPDRGPCLAVTSGLSPKVTDYSPLANRTVCIWFDASEAGRKAAMSVAGHLAKIAAKVLVITVWDAGLYDGWCLKDADGDIYGPKTLLELARKHTKTVDGPPLTAPARLSAVPPPGAVVIEPTAPVTSLIGKWQAMGLLSKTNQQPYHSQANVGLVLAHRNRLPPDDPDHMDLWYNDFTHRVMLGSRPWGEIDTVKLTTWLQVQLGFGEMRQAVVADGVMAYACERHRNPPKDWMESLEWDGKSRLAGFMCLGVGSKNTPYTQAVGRCFFVSMVARVYQPGCKADYMVIFEGKQGIKKSTMLRVIGGEYFAEVHTAMGDKDFYLAITGRFLAELGELNSVTSARDWKQIKGIISNQTDTFRKPYGRVTEDVPRTCIFAGTTNDDNWNRDETGARRFWPIRCREINIDWITENRDQLFAEAVERFKDGEPWWDVPTDAAQDEQAARYHEDAWTPIIQDYLASRDEVQIAAILTDQLNVKIQEIDYVKQHRVAMILKQRGWKNTVRRNPDNNRTERRWVRTEETEG